LLYGTKYFSRMMRTKIKFLRRPCHHHLLASS
jgi:hypothetical protein